MSVGRMLLTPVAIGKRSPSKIAKKINGVSGNPSEKQKLPTAQGETLFYRKHLLLLSMYYYGVTDLIELIESKHFLTL